MRLAIVCPTRGRADLCAGMVRSALDTSDADLLLYADNDDPDAEKVFRLGGQRVTALVGEPIGRGAAVNALCDQHREYDTYLMVSDDIHFVRNGWDREVEAAMEAFGDGIGLVHLASENGQPHANWCVLHRRWLDATGWFNWPECRWFCQDTILQTLAEALGRITLIEPQVLEHQCLAPADVEARLDHDCRRMLWFYAQHFGATLAKLKGAMRCGG